MLAKTHDSHTALVQRAHHTLTWGRTRPGIRLVLASVVPGLPFLVARALLHQHSGIFNVDFLLLTLLAAAGFRVLASALFAVVYVLESVRLLDAVYFFSEQDITFASHFLSAVPGWLIAAWVLAFAVVCGCALGVWRLLVPTVPHGVLVRAALPLLALSAVAASVDVLQGFNPLLVKPHGRARPHLIGEVLFRMPVELSRTMGHDEASTVVAYSATAPLWASAPVRSERQNVVVVVVESMGLLVDPVARAREFSTLANDPAVHNRYTLTEGTVPFTGATVPGEMRELCRLRTNVHIGPATLANKGPCLPQQFQAAGYQTAAYHGFEENMFLRKDWYPKLGFDQRYFNGQMQTLPHCTGAFYGVCDSAIAALIEQRLVQQRQAGQPPQFLYWMTLNSHLPIDEATAPAGDCPLIADHTVCGQLGLVQMVLTAVKKLALDPEIGRTTIVVVGDHAPPYADVHRRDLFDESNVPFLVLQPRE